MGTSTKPWWVASRKDRNKSKWAGPCAGFTAFLGIVFIVVGFLVLFYFRDLIDAVINSKVQLREDSEVTAKWIKPPIEPKLRIYFFNVTNLDSFLNGSKPKLDQVGPYVYDEIWEKVNVKFSADGTQVEYAQKKTYFFNANESFGSENDIILVPNVPMISALNELKWSTDPNQETTLMTLLSVLNQALFLRMSVMEAAWGQDHPLLSIAKGVKPEGKKPPFTKFGFFVGKNESTSGVLRAWTGTINITDLGQLISFNGKTRLPFWENDTCNNITGTDGSIYRPGIKETDVLRIFNKDLCRSLPLVFKDYVDMKGIPGFRFVPPSDVFGTPEENPANSCFCVTSEGCSTPSGLFNMSECQFGAPIMLSWPHFFQADPKLLEAVEGLNPTEEEHQFFIDMQPKLGNGLRAFARTQVNVLMSKANDSFDIAKGLRDIVYPILWFSEGIDGIDDPDTLELLNNAIFVPEKIRSVLYPALLGVGVFILVLVALFAAKRLAQKRMPKSEPILEPSVDEAFVKKDDEEDEM